jgi:response regulator RpfG family c-di-GMP phosphodiesterase
MLGMLLKQGLITEHQAGRIEAGTTFGLVLGNYRVLDRLGDGGMAVVFRAEHLDLRQQVAIKVLPINNGQDSSLRSRFSAEMRTIAQLCHPNIVAARDAGRVAGPTPLSQQLLYLVMEYVSGMDLERFVNFHGPLPPGRAVDLVYQIASALVETNKHNLVHRDIKPSNIMIVGEDVAKLLDFGLSRNFEMRLTEPGVILGTIDYMAPEQARDARSVDIRADIYGLGGTLFWCLTGRLPFRGGRNLIDCLAQRMTATPPSARAIRPEIPPELDAVIARMMATNPDDRYLTPESVRKALLPFLRPERFGSTALPLDCTQEAVRSSGAGSRAGLEQLVVHRVLIADDDESIRQFVRMVLEVAPGVEAIFASDGKEAWDLLMQYPVDLVLLDANLPEITGPELLHRIRAESPSPNLKVIVMSGNLSPDDLADLLTVGADDFLHKPFSVMQLQRRIQSALRLKEVQDRAMILNQHLLVTNKQLEQTITSKDANRDALISIIGRAVAQRNGELPQHPQRVRRYCRVLAEMAARCPSFKDQLTPEYIAQLASFAPLYDLGTISLPDHLLLKPGRLESDERMLMQMHTSLGGEIVRAVLEEQPIARPFLQLVLEIVEGHHERWDGTGYPLGLAGNEIPLPARIFTIVDVYEALRSRRSYRPALTHQAAVQMICDGAGKQFDPALIQAFLKVAPEFDLIFREGQDNKGVTGSWAVI